MQDDKKAPNWLTRLARVRMADWVIAAALLTMVVWLIAPHQVPVTVYKLSLVALAAVSGYWIDRSIFPYARPNIDALRLIEPMPDFEVSKAEVDRGMVETDHGEVPLAHLECAIDGWPNYGELYYFAATQIRRALIVSATILAVSLGA